MNLRLDWCSHEAAKYAVMHWHYSKCMPCGKMVKIGIWENDKFIGVIIFGLGAGNATSGKRFGIKETFRVVELERIALTKHENTVTKMVSIAIKMLKKQSPKLKLIISFADPRQKHLGKIYQAGNWIYYGQSSKVKVYKDEYGKEHHNRNTTTSGFTNMFGKLMKCRKRSDLEEIECEGKYTYLMPLNKELKEKLSKLAKPYPRSDNASVV